ncbi:MAG: hypothetical protein AAFO94_21300, partial [Bacteroidota bacterium]
AVLAKQLVNLRKQKTRTYTTGAQISAVGMQAMDWFDLLLHGFPWLLLLRLGLLQIKSLRQKNTQ